MEAQHAEGVRRAAADREAGSESREGEPVAPVAMEDRMTS
jgi:hypothetical protein